MPTLIFSSSMPVHTHPNYRAYQLQSVHYCCREKQQGRVVSSSFSGLSAFFPVDHDHACSLKTLSSPSRSPRLVPVCLNAALPKATSLCCCDTARCSMFYAWTARRFERAITRQSRCTHSSYLVDSPQQPNSSQRAMLSSGMLCYPKFTCRPSRH